MISYAVFCLKKKNKIKNNIFLFFFFFFFFLMIRRPPRSTLSSSSAASDVYKRQIISLDDVVGSFEKNIIKYACEKYGSTRKAAKGIGISQTQLIRKKKKYEL